MFMVTVITLFFSTKLLSTNMIIDSPPYKCTPIESSTIKPYIQGWASSHTPAVCMPYWLSRRY